MLDMTQEISSAKKAKHCIEILDFPPKSTKEI